MNKKFQKRIDSIIPGNSTAVRVVDNDISYALRLFKKEVKDSNKLKEYYSRKEFTKPSIIRRDQLALARYKNAKGLENEN